MADNETCVFLFFVLFCFVLFCKTPFVPRTQRNLHYKKINELIQSLHYIIFEGALSSLTWWIWADIERRGETKYKYSVAVLNEVFPSNCNTTFYFSSQHFNTTNCTFLLLTFSKQDHCFRFNASKVNLWLIFVSLHATFPTTQDWYQPINL